MPEFPKTEKITFRLRQDLADRLPKPPDAWLNSAVESAMNGLTPSSAAATLGRISSPAKTAAARENAKKPRSRKKPE